MYVFSFKCDVIELKYIASFYHFVVFFLLFKFFCSQVICDNNLFVFRAILLISFRILFYFCKLFLYLPPLLSTVQVEIHFNFSYMFAGKRSSLAIAIKCFTKCFRVFGFFSIHAKLSVLFARFKLQLCNIHILFSMFFLCLTIYESLQ